MVMFASVAVALAWAVSVTLKLMNIDVFREDAAALAGESAKRLAPIVPLIELLLCVGLVTPPSRHLAALSSSATILVFTASFVIRAVRGRSLACACFGRRGPVDEVLTPDFRGVVRSAAQSGWVFIGNSTFLALAVVASGQPHWVLPSVSVTGVIMLAAAVLNLAASQREAAMKPHPRLPAMIPHRQALFATDWIHGVWTGWLICFRPGNRQSQ